jgi:hypothetical protein
LAKAGQANGNVERRAPSHGFRRHAGVGSIIEEKIDQSLAAR